MNYTYASDNAEYLLSVLKDGDTVTVSAEDFISLIQAEKPRKGRKPISLDLYLFDEVVGRWNNGEITAREAMRLLDLKPNTFYRRIKERNLSEMKNVKEEISEAKKLMHKEAREAREDLKELKHQVRSDAKEVIQNIEERKKPTGTETT